MKPLFCRSNANRTNTTAVLCLLGLATALCALNPMNFKSRDEKPGVKSEGQSSSVRSLASPSLQFPFVAGTTSARTLDETTKADRRLFPSGAQHSPLSLELGFEANRGQTDPSVKFLARGNGSALFLTPTEVVLAVDGERPETNSVLRLRPASANPSPRMVAENRLSETKNYLVGKTAREHQRNIPTHGRIRYRDIYPGIDLVYYGTGRRLEYDVVVSPGSDPNRIRFQLEGVEKTELDHAGNLVLTLAGGQVVQEKPVAYQRRDGNRTEIAAKYSLFGKNEFGFEIGDYDHDRPLVIDPILNYSTFWGGSGGDKSYRIAVDSSGNAYVVGSTPSLNFPTATPAQTASGGGHDVFIAKLNSTGTAALFSTYLGGSGNEFGHGVALDGSGNPVVVGVTDSPNFPLQNARQTTLGGGSDAFVTRLSAQGNSILYSTYFGGARADVANAVWVNPVLGEIHIAGATDSENFPTAGPLNVFRGKRDAFVAKINPSVAPSSQLLHVALVGGTDLDTGYGLAIDNTSNIYLVGSTRSTDFPTVNAVQSAPGGNGDYFGDAFVVRLNSNASTLSASTFLGGGGDDAAFTVAAGASGTILVAGVTKSANFPLRNALQTSAGGPSDIFVAKLNQGSPPASQLIYSSRLGGSDDDQCNGLVFSGGAVFLTGQTTSTDFPGFERATAASGMDSFVAKLPEINSGNGLSLGMVTVLGGGGNDFGEGLAVGATGDVYVAGRTVSTDFPTLNPIQPTSGGGQDAFVLKLRGCPSVTISPATLPSVTAGTTFSQTFTASGGTGPHRFAVTVGSPTPGLTLTPQGVLSGTPTAAGTFTFGLTATDTEGCNSTSFYSQVVQPPLDCTGLALAPNALPSIRVFSFFSQQLTASGGTAPYTLVKESGTLPAGMTFEPAGFVMGTPTETGTFTFTVRATDSRGCFILKTYELKVCPNMGITPDFLPATSIGQPYSQQLSVTGNTTPITFSIASGALPTGLTLSSDGLISGTATQNDGGYFTVRATNSAGCFVEREYVLTVGCPTHAITPETVPNAVVGTPYSQVFTASGGASPYTFSIREAYIGDSPEPLPPGLSMSSEGVYSGTPTTSGDHYFQVVVRDASGCESSRTIQLTIDCPAVTVTPDALPDATVNQPYSQTLTASGGLEPYSFSISNGSLPSGLDLAPTGELSGTPLQAGDFAFTVAVGFGDNSSCTHFKDYALRVPCPTVEVNPATLPDAALNQPYQQTLTASGGTEPYRFETTAGAPPDGIQLQFNGELSGTPSRAGSFTFTVRATDASGCSGTRDYTVTVGGCAEVTLSTGLPNGQVGSPYNQPVTASGGAEPYTFIVTSGELPTGLTLSAEGVLSGTPTAPGSFTFTVKATDSSGCEGNREYTITVGGCAEINLLPTTLPSGTVGAIYSQTLTAEGGTSPYSFTVTTGAPPQGLTLSSTGTLTGTPTTSETTSFTVKATDAQGCEGTREYSLAITSGCETVTLSTTLSGGFVGVAYSRTITATGGTAPHTFAVTQGTLPAGLELAAVGVLSGIPTTDGTFTFTVTATDGQGCTGVREYVVGVGTCPTVTVSPATLPIGIAGTPFNQVFSASGGVPPYALALTSGTLPAGLIFSTDNRLTGTPTETGTFTFTIRASDANGCAGEKAYLLTIAAACPTLGLDPATLPAALQGVSYSQSLAASGGTPPYLLAVSSGSLPPGLVLSNSGVLSGTPATTDTFTFTVTATDAVGCTGSRAYSMTVGACSTITLSPAALPNATQGTIYSQSLTASGGTAPHVFTVISGTLPTGLTLSNQGFLNGTPSVSGNFVFTVRATDSAGCTGQKAYTLAVAAPCPTIALSPANLPNALQGVAYSQSVTATGGASPHAFLISNGALPAGLLLSSTGALTGTATVSGSFTFTVRATDAQGCTGEKAYTLTVGTCPTITLQPAGLPSALQSVAYSQTVTASGGTAPYTFQISAGALPAGLTLGASGTLAGTPTVTGNFTFTVRATDAQGCTGERAHTLTVGDCPTISLTPPTLPRAFQGLAYSQTLVVDGGASPYLFTLSEGSLPPGLALNGAGTISGTPTATGSFTFTVTVTDSVGCQGTQSFTLTVGNCPTITLQPATLPTATQGSSYTQSVTAQGAAAPYLFAVVAGSLPTGLTLNTGGQITGTPGDFGVFAFTVRATDSNGCTGHHEYTLEVACPGGTIIIQPALLPNAFQGVSYTQTLTAQGGTAPHTFETVSGTLPTGLVLSAQGVISGTPGAVGSFSFTVRTTDATGCSNDKLFTLTVGTCPTIAVAPGTLPNATQNTAYSQTLTASGGLSPYTFTLASGTLPTGLTLGTTGTLFGTPTVSGSFTFTVRATASGGCSAEKTYTLIVSVPCPTIALAPATLPNATHNAAYSQAITASGGASPYGFTVSSGTLPAGLTLSPTGLVSGTPTASGSFAFTVRATDAASCLGEKTYTLIVSASCPTITLQPATLPNGTQGSAYVQTLTASGGVGPHTFTLASGTLPNGLALTSNGTLSGTPTASGGFTFSIRATDAAGCTGTQAYTISIACPTVTITPTSLADPVRNASYTLALRGNGGQLPYTFALASGTLPPGLTLSATGLLSGTATTTGSFTFTVRVTDNRGCTGTQTYTVTVVTNCPTITLLNQLPQGVVGSPYSLALTAGGGGTVYAWALTSGTLPSGMALSPDGVLSGTPAAVGNSTFTLKATASNGCFGTKTYTFTAVPTCPAISLSPALPGGVVGTPYTMTVRAEGVDHSPYTFSLVSGVLPTGLAFASNGLVSGTPTAAGNTSLTIRATAANGCFGTQTYTLGVVSGCSGTPVIAPATVPGTTVGVPYNQTLTASGGVGPYSFVVSAGQLPDGLNLSTIGVLSGIPTASGSFTFTVTATGANGCPGHLTYSGFQVGDVIVRHAPSMNGTVEGNLRLVGAEDVTLNGGAVITHDLLVPGTPTLRANGNPNFGGTVTGPGNPSPTNHQITLNGNATLGRLLNRIDPVALPTVAAPPAPTGTRDVTITSQGGNIGDPATLRNLTLNGNVGTVAVPPGTYGNFIANGGSGFILGVAGASQPSVYNLQNLNLNGNSQIQIVGPVVLTLANGTSINAAFGNAGNPFWLRLQVASGGLTLNGGSAFHGTVVAPNGTVIVNGNSTLRGSLACDRLTINGGGLVQAAGK